MSDTDPPGSSAEPAPGTPAGVATGPGSPEPVDVHAPARDVVRPSAEVPPAAPTAVRPRRDERRRLHPAAVRVMHWTNAVCMLVMITSGWGIYDDDVIVPGFLFPGWARLGSWAAPSLNWHFAAMWPLAFNGLVYLVYGVSTGRLRERLLPVRRADIVHTIRETLHLKLAHEDLTTYNAVQKLLYMVAIGAGVSQVVTGIALWKPVQFSWVVALLGGFQSVRIIHFAGMSILVGFLAVHVALALLVPQTLVAMIGGGPRVPRRRRGREAAPS